MKTKQLIPLMVIAFAIIFTSCSKDGPAGPVGPQGPAGTAGTAGAAGAKGETGTANVIYSPWINNSVAEWKDTTLAYGIKAGRAIRKAPQLSQSVLNTGIVLVYFNTSSGIYQLPYTLNVGSSFNNPTPILTNYSPQVGQIIYYATNTGNNLAHSWGPSTGTQFRYVIIPGGVAASGRLGTSEKFALVKGKTFSESQLKKMSYSEVSSLFNIAQ